MVTLRRATIAVVVVLGACTPTTLTGGGVTATNHPPFPIGAGAVHELGKLSVDGEFSCESCHANPDTFSTVHCDSCHRHGEAITPRLHLGVATFFVDTSGTTDPSAKADLRGKSCVGCHPTGEPRAFSHTQITDQCAECHDVGAAFAALPKPGFTHRAVGQTDCGACHVTSTWTDVSAAPNDASDPTRSVTVNALKPTWVGTAVTAVTPDPQLIPMRMNHRTTAVDAAVMGTCGNCHAQAAQGQYYPGVLHWSLVALGAPQPATCDECHGSAGPQSFVGALDPRRTPSTGEMRHDAVVWSGGAPTATRILTAGCVTCHQPPTDQVYATWSFGSGKGDAGVAKFHGSLTEAGLAQPSACLDCHDTSRPVGAVQAAGLSFDHAVAPGECADCHRSTDHWSGGQYHTAAAAAPASCLPCHAGERPTGTTGWHGGYANSPFDYGPNANGVNHGADQDCVVCHAGPGTGAWGSTQNWQSGRFDHAVSGVAGSTCIDCHTTQRPDLQTPPADAGFDHATSGTGDCFGCHQATVTRNAYLALLPIPGGDWRGGQTYPGASLISTPGRSVRVPSTTLTRSGTTVTGMTTATVTLPNAFLHTSSAIPAAISPGPTGAPDQCWHCHTSTGTTVTAYANGAFHASLSTFRSSPAAGITPLAQPTACGDCHRGMRPPNIVSRTDAGTWLLPMDHAATFTGGAVTGVPAMDCSSCHRTPGLGPTQWSDGRFHPNLPGGAAPSECVGCHYPLVTTAQADVTVPASGLPNTFSMKHRSGVVTLQACATCHGNALAAATTAPTATTLWKTGAYHPSLSAQPTSCLDCHAGTDPTGATQGTVRYSMPQGGTTTNGAQWMNHTDPSVTGKDCATCHQADATTTGAPWSPATAFHAKVPSVTACAGCHGLTNGKGSVVGTNNNLPAGLIDTATTTTSSAAAAGTHDQLSHADSNVTRMDCRFCHTQVGPSTVGGVQGVEWSKATFHRNFTTANPLVVNGGTGRCSNCHLNVKPGASYTQQDHSGFTATSTQDCSSCHSYPGTNAATPNWLGATGAHASSGSTATSTLDCNTCHGLNGSSAKHLAVAASSHYGGISNGNRCTTCHIDFTGFKDTVTNLQYPHTNATANSGGCVTCHAYASQLYTTLTNTPALSHPTTSGGHQFSQTYAVTGSFNGQSFNSNHTNSGLTRCGACHQYSTTTSTTNIWTFKHRPSNAGISNSQSSGGCSMCH